MRSALARAWKWSALGALAVAGVLAATAATTGSAATADTTTTGSTTTTTTASTSTTTTTATTTAGTKPSNSAAPTISGTAQDDSSLAAGAGTWSGTQPISFAYDWQRCDSHGSSCADISGADDQTYKLTSADVGNTVRVKVTASNSAGSTTAYSAASSPVAAAPAPTTTTAPKPAPTGCPDVAKNVVVGVNSVNAPARLQIADFDSVPGRLTHSTDGFTLRVIVKDTCGHRVAGALVYATAVPYNQFDVPAEKATDASGTAVLTFHRESGYPASRRQQLLAMFIRARDPGDPVLSGISSRRLIALPVEH